MIASVLESSRGEKRGRSQDDPASPDTEESATPEETDAAATESDDGDALTQDELFHILQNRRRRGVLEYLRGVTGPVEMSDVAEQLAAWEHDTTVEQLDSTQRKRLYVPLYQTHLPKLDDAGVIDYDKDRGQVEARPLAGRLEPYLEVGLDPDRGDEGGRDTDGQRGDEETPADPAVDGGERESEGWLKFELGAVSCSSAVLGGAVLGVPPLTGISMTLLAYSVFGVLSAVGLHHLHTVAGRAEEP